MIATSRKLRKSFQKGREIVSRLLDKPFYSCWKLNNKSNKCDVTGLGQTLAYAEMRLVIARLVWDFDLEGCFDANWSDQKVFMVWDKPALMVKLVPVRSSA
jgi:hypothetical protein